MYDCIHSNLYDHVWLTCIWIHIHIDTHVFGHVACLQSHYIYSQTQTQPIHNMNSNYIPNPNDYVVQCTDFWSHSIV